MRLLAYAIFAAPCTVAIAAPPTVTYTVAGTSGDYTLDFSVTNNLGVPGMYLYFFGVQLSQNNPVGSPDPFDSTLFTSWDNVAYGGSSEIYNNMWFVPTTYTGVQDGQTQNGFRVQVTDAIAPDSVRWFTYAYSESASLSYLGGDNFNTPQVPGFEGVAAVPEPATISLLGLGLAAISGKRRR